MLRGETWDWQWDETRCGRDVVLSNGSTTVTRSNGNEWGGVLGAQLFVHGAHSFTFVINKCQTDYVYVVRLSLSVYFLQSGAYPSRCPLRTVNVSCRDNRGLHTTTSI
jgi:hypothetical protein